MKCLKYFKINCFKYFFLNICFVTEFENVHIFCEIFFVTELM